jgi:hypothetical protein
MHDECMLRLHYSGESVLIATEVGEALLRYARALAESHAADVVSVLVVNGDGELSAAEFLLGPASQLYSTAVDSGPERGDDRDVIDDLERRLRRLNPSAHVAAQPPDPSTTYDPDNP